MIPKLKPLCLKNINNLLKLADELLPISMMKWETVMDTHMPHFTENSKECLKLKFYDIIHRMGPMGDLNCPSYAIKEKAINQWIVAMNNGSTE